MCKMKLGRKFHRGHSRRMAKSSYSRFAAPWATYTHARAAARPTIVRVATAVAAARQPGGRPEGALKNVKPLCTVEGRKIGRVGTTTDRPREGGRLPAFGASRLSRPSPLSLSLSKLKEESERYYVRRIKQANNGERV